MRKVIDHPGDIGPQCARGKCRSCVGAGDSLRRECYRPDPEVRGLSGWDTCAATQTSADSVRRHSVGYLVSFEPISQS